MPYLPRSVTEIRILHWLMRGQRALEEERDKREEILTESPWRLFRRLSVPAILGMMMYAVYTLVDAIFVGHWVGKQALAAVTIVFPLLIVNSAITAFMAMGSASLLSRAIGAEDEKTVSRIFGNFAILIILSSAVYMILGFLFARQLVGFMGASGTILDLGIRYFRITLIGACFINFYGGANILIRAEGHMREAMLIIAAGSLMNVILDPIFIKVLDMGIEGAAVASVISWTAGAIITLGHYLRSSSRIVISRKGFRLAPELMKDIAPVGASAMSMQLMTVFQQIMIFKSIAHYGKDDDFTLIAASLNMLTFAFIPLWGIGQGLQPVIGTNFGAGKFPRVKDSFRTFLLAATAVAGVIWVIFQLFPGVILGLYITDPGMVTSGTGVFRTLTFMFFLYGFIVLPITLFQAIGKGWIASFLILTRHVILFGPIVILLPMFMGIDGVWMAIPLSDALIVAISSILVIRELRHLGAQEPAGTGETSK